MKSTLNSLKYATVAVACAAAAYAAAPTGWFIAGTKPSSYESGVDTQATLNGLSSACLKSVQPVPEGFGTLMQNFSAAQYVGQRVRFSAMVKSAGLDKSAGLWMRVDGDPKSPATRVLSFDNMGDRSIKGTTGWTRYDVVLDVPEGATGIAFGIMLEGAGEVWLNDVSFTSVGTNVPTTGRPMQPSSGPTNLGFETH